MVEAQRQDVDWAAVRRAYELTDETIREICIRFDITKSVFEGRCRKERWLSRQASRRDRRGSTRDRLLALLDRQVVKLANRKGDELTDSETKQLTELVKNFGALSGPGETAADNGGPQKKDMQDLRNKLAKRIDQFNRR